MKEEFLRFISEKKLCTAKDKILLAVSGGKDSMVMLHLFRKCGFNISVAHVNFQLRGDESDGDELFVRKTCEEFSIPCFSKRVDTSEYAEGNSLSIQMAARELRYSWFNELMTEHHYDCVATAHHLNDSMETVLLNFVRGSGVEGFDGIATKNRKIIRPLLFATQQQIESYATENKISWREDSSNASDDYQRNFIRHKIVPLLKELNPSLENSFKDSIEKVSGAVELIGSGIEHWKEKFETTKDKQVLLAKDGLVSEGLLWNLIRHYGFNLDQCRQTIKALHGQPGKKFSSTEFELVIDRKHLIISKNENKLTEVWIEKDQAEASLGKHTLKISNSENKNPSKDNSIALLDADKLRFPLKWRKWRAGDYFYPLGMNHKKKLSDFLIDQKISVADKEAITVLESGSEIVWVVGYRIDERFKLTSPETRLVKIAQV